LTLQKLIRRDVIAYNRALGGNNTAKLSFFIDGHPVEFEGTVDEVTDFLKTIQKQKIPLATSEEERKQTEYLVTEKAEVKKAKQNLPSVEKVKQYILSLPSYKHTTFDVQEHFFGRTFKARGVTEGLYHEFLRLVTEARQQIEREKSGSFDFILESGRHKVYRWMPTTVRGRLQARTGVEEV
jgi:hypothetical protein